MRLGLFAREDDASTRHIAKRCAARGVEPFIIDLTLTALGEPIAWDGEEWIYRGETISSCDAFLVRSVPAEVLAPPPGVKFDSGEAYWRFAMQAKERAQTAQSCLFDLERSGKRMINPYWAIFPCERKPAQLRTLQAAGLPVPRTLVTNFPAAVRAFCADVGEVIHKPVAGGAEAGLLDDEGMQRLDELRASPVIFQERIRGTDIRVTIAGGRVVSSVEIPTTTLDYRTADSYKQGGQQYPDHRLSADGERIALAAARACGHLFAGVDLKHRPDGSYVVIESNSSPVYLDVELKTGHQITDALLDLAVGR